MPGIIQSVTRIYQVDFLDVHGNILASKRKTAKVIPTRWALRRMDENYQYFTFQASEIGVTEKHEQ